jgi:hypothetical protein
METRTRDHPACSTVPELTTLPPSPKVNLSLGLINYTPRNQDVWDSGGIAPLYLTSSRDGSDELHAPTALDRLNNWVGTGCDDEQDLLLPYAERNVDYSPSLVQQPLVAIPTEVTCLLLANIGTIVTLRRMRYVRYAQQFAGPGFKTNTQLCSETVRACVKKKGYKFRPASANSQAITNGLTVMEKMSTSDI